MITLISDVKKNSVLLALCCFTIFVSFVLNLILGIETTKLKITQCICILGIEEKFCTFNFMFFCEQNVLSNS